MGMIELEWWELEAESCHSAIFRAQAITRPTMLSACSDALHPGANVVALATFTGPHFAQTVAWAEDVGFEVRDCLLLALPDGLLGGALLRKPPEGTVANNALVHGTGGMNIDGCRIEMGSEYDPSKVQRQQSRGDGVIDGAFGASSLVGTEIPTYKPGGRWPANLMFCHEPGCDSDCVAECPVATLNEQSGDRPAGHFPTQRSEAQATGFGVGQPTPGGARSMGDSGGASRYFRCVENEQELLAYLCRLITPANGAILDPSGSTEIRVAAESEGFDYVGIRN